MLGIVHKLVQLRASDMRRVTDFRTKPTNIQEYCTFAEEIGKASDGVTLETNPEYFSNNIALPVDVTIFVECVTTTKTDLQQRLNFL